MSRFPGFELTGVILPPGLVQLGHDVGVLRGEPVLKFVQSLHGPEDGRGNFEDSGFHDGEKRSARCEWLKSIPPMMGRIFGG